jgi:hemolysin-activating ACP:hemolysin acyltransferase
MDIASLGGGDAAFRLFRPDKPAVALGLAVSHLMTKPVFASLRFGEWSRILVGQINRGHYVFAVDRAGQVRGFVGWALTTQDRAEAWVEGRRALAFEECLRGDCLLFNAWSADTPAVHRFLVGEARQFGRIARTLYFRRYYPDGRIRPVIMPVNQFVSSHARRKVRPNTEDHPVDAA